jgi:hypothetical protein
MKLSVNEIKKRAFCNEVEFISPKGYKIFDEWSDFEITDNIKEIVAFNMDYCICEENEKLYWIGTLEQDKKQIICWAYTDSLEYAIDSL